MKNGIGSIVIIYATVTLLVFLECWTTLNVLRWYHLTKYINPSFGELVGLRFATMFFIMKVNTDKKENPTENEIEILVEKMKRALLGIGLLFVTAWLLHFVLF